MRLFLSTQHIPGQPGIYSKTVKFFVGVQLLICHLSRTVKCNDGLIKMDRHALPPCLPSTDPQLSWPLSGKVMWGHVPIVSGRVLPGPSLPNTTVGRASREHRDPYVVI